MTILDFGRRVSAGTPIVMATCYDAPFARLLTEAGIDCLLVGDSVAMVVHGHVDTLAADLPMMVLHTSAVARGAGDAFVVADLPFGAARRGLTEAVDASIALMRAGARAVKLEGADGNLETVRHLVDSGIPVMGHVGLTPQFMNVFGGFKVQGKTDDAARKVASDAAALEDAGCFALVLEGIPAPLAKKIADERSIACIGIGAGVDVDGQVLVLHDLLGLSPTPRPRFARAFANLSETVVAAAKSYADSVVARTFPATSETYK